MFLLLVFIILKRINKLTLFIRLNDIKIQISYVQHIVCYALFSTTSSINPKDLAVSAVIKLSLSSAVLISSTFLPVCLEYISLSLFLKKELHLHEFLYLLLDLENQQMVDAP